MNLEHFLIDPVMCLPHVLSTKLIDFHTSVLPQHLFTEMLSAVNQNSLTQQKASGKAENTKPELRLSCRNASFVSISLSRWGPANVLEITAFLRNQSFLYGLIQISGGKSMIARKCYSSFDKRTGGCLMIIKLQISACC